MLNIFYLITLGLTYNYRIGNTKLDMTYYISFRNIIIMIRQMYHIGIIFLMQKGYLAIKSGRNSTRDLSIIIIQYMIPYLNICYSSNEQCITCKIITLTIIQNFT